MMRNLILQMLELLVAPWMMVELHGMRKGCTIWFQPSCMQVRRLGRVVPVKKRPSLLGLS